LADILTQLTLADNARDPTDAPTPTQAQANAISTSMDILSHFMQDDYDQSAMGASTYNINTTAAAADTVDAEAMAGAEVLATRRENGKTTHASIVASSNNTINTLNLKKLNAFGTKRWQGGAPNGSVRKWS
jgi:hypothetical protein